MGEHSGEGIGYLDLDGGVRLLRNPYLLLGLLAEKDILAQNGTMGLFAKKQPCRVAHSDNIILG